MKQNFLGYYRESNQIKCAYLIFGKKIYLVKKSHKKLIKRVYSNLQNYLTIR